MAYKVQFETTAKQIAELPLVQIGTKRMVELGDGRLADFDDPFNYAKHGLEKWIKTIAVPDPLPEPFNPLRAEAIQELRAALSRYPGDDYQALLNRNPKMKNAIDRDFPGVSLKNIQEWTALVESETERIKQERIRAIPPPTLSQSQLTKHFYHSRADYGDLIIDGPDPKQHGTKANNFEDAQWWVRCKCEKDKGPEIRFTTARYLLQIECGYSPKYVCQGPCKN